MKKIINILTGSFLLLCFSIPTVVAQTFYSDSDNSGFGGIAQQFIQGPMTLVRQFMDDALIFTGIILLIISMHQFVRHRRNPQEMPLSHPVMYLILGVILILLPLAYYVAKQTGGVAL